MLEEYNNILSGLNDKQREAVVSDAKRLLVLAGAGSGKTKTVISKLLHLVSEKNVKPSSILAITFTKNAANEMIDRLIVSSDPTNTYETFIQNKTTTPAQKEVERRKRIQEQPWISNLTIKTFHSLCYKILRDNGNPVFDNKFKLITDNSAEDVDLIAKDIPLQSIQLGKDEGDILVLGWGSTYGVITTVVQKLIQEGKQVSHCHLRYIRPFPSNLNDILKKFKKVIVPEINNGQLVKILRSEFLVDAIAYNKIKGVPITQLELENFLLQHL